MRGWVIAAALLAGCSGSGGSAPDAGPDLDADDTDAGLEIAPPAPPAPPAAPAAPRMTPCPAGWREVVDADAPDVITCDPWPEGGRQDCAPDEAHFPGGAGCERIGTGCPAGDWADDIPEDVVVVHVRAGAAPGGDGTQESPYARIAEAVSAAPDDAVVAISRGTFDEVVTVDHPLSLWGACVAETLVAPSIESEEQATLTVTGDGVLLRNLQVTGPRGGVDVYAADVRIESLLVAGAMDYGVRVTAAGVLAASDLVARDTRARTSDGWHGFGLDVFDGARVDVARASFERNTSLGVTVAEPGTELSASDLAVSDTAARSSDGALGFGVGVYAGASVELTRAVVERSVSVGIQGDAPGSSLVATDLLVRDTWAAPDLGYGYGLSLDAGARAELTRATLEGNRQAAAYARGSGTELVATELVVRGTLPRESDRAQGSGLVLEAGAHGAVTRAAFARNRSACLEILDADTELLATDVAVRDTLSRESDLEGGAGLVVYSGARAQIVRGTFEENRFAGLYAEGPGTALVATDVLVRGTLAQESSGTTGSGVVIVAGAGAEILRGAFEDNRSDGLLVLSDGALVATDVAVRDTREQESDGRFGDGLYVGRGTSVEVLRGTFERNRYAGLQVVGGQLTATDVVVADTRSDAASGVGGYGLAVWEGGAAALTRASLEGNRGAGVLSLFGVASLDRSEVTLEDVVVAGTLEQACVETGCDGLGSGIVARDGSVVATRFRVSDSALCGVQVAVRFERTAAMDLHDGEISGNPIGANVQVDDFDVSRLEDHVLYLDNGRSLDSSRLALPDALDEFEL